MFKIFLDESGAGGGSVSAQGQAKTADESNGQASGELAFDAWLETQDEKIKGLLDGHTKGLKTALDSERETRKGLERQVRDLATKAEKGSQAEKDLTEFADKIAEADRKAEFYDAAHKAGVSNLRLAYITAVTEGLFDKKGNVDFAGMKTNFPELFGVRKAAAGNAGDGTESTETNIGGEMNRRIRRASGRSS